MRDYGLQMYSLHSISTSDLKRSLRTASKIGFTQVEFAGFFDHSPEEVRSYLEEYGLKAISTHTRFDKLSDDQIQNTIAEHKLLGIKEITIPGFVMNTREELDDAIRAINFAEPILREAGISLAVHNHAREFTLTSYGVLAHKEIERLTSAKFQLDTYWIFAAGKDPVEAMDYYHSVGRLSSIHLRDGLRNGTSKPLGEGEAPVEAVLKRALELNVPIIVENEGFAEVCTEECQRCFDFLRRYHEINRI